MIIKQTLVLNLIILVIVALWFKDGFLFGGGEGGIPYYNPENTLELYAYLWKGTDIGIPGTNDLLRVPYWHLMSVLHQFGIQGYVLQALTFFTLASIGSTSILFLVRYILTNNLKNTAIPFVAGLFYFLNPFSMTQVWGRGLLVQFFTFAIFPLSLLLFIVGIEKRVLFLPLIIALASALFADAFSHPSFIMAYWFMLFSYTIYYCWLNRRKTKLLAFGLSFFGLTFLSWALINGWWIWPYYKTVTSNISGLTAALDQTQYNISIFESVSRQYPLWSIIRLIHDGPLYEGKYYGQIYSNFLFILISFLIPLCLFLSFKVFSKVKSSKYFIWLFILSFFFVAGNNLPFGPIMKFLFEQIVLLQAFRNPFEKFGIVYLIAYTPLFAVGAYVLADKINKKFPNINSQVALGFIVLLICGVFSWPMWYGNFAGGFIFNPWVEVPKYYQEANEFLEKDKSDVRIIHLPLTPGDGVKYLWPHSYSGSEPADQIFNKTSISKNWGSNKVAYNVLLDRFGYLQKNIFGADPDISNSELKSDKFSKELAKLNVKYVVVHHDIDYQLIKSVSPEQIINYLAQDSNFKKLQTFGQLDIYEVMSDPEVAHIYSPEHKVTFAKLDPTKYLINVPETLNPFELFFLEKFDPNWVITSEGKEVGEHSSVFAYANKWKLGQMTESQLVLRYRVQDHVDFGYKITLYGFIGLGLFFLVSILFQKKASKLVE